MPVCVNILILHLTVSIELYYFESFYCATLVLLT